VRASFHARYLTFLAGDVPLSDEAPDATCISSCDQHHQKSPIHSMRGEGKMTKGEKAGKHLHRVACSC
jgi:hypothetical protein